jgi:hypothetical protein
MKNHFNRFIKVLQLDKGGEYNLTSSQTFEMNNVLFNNSFKQTFLTKMELLKENSKNLKKTINL